MPENRDESKFLSPRRSESWQMERGTVGPARLKPGGVVTTPARKEFPVMLWTRTSLLLQEEETEVGRHVWRDSGAYRPSRVTGV